MNTTIKEKFHDLLNEMIEEEVREQIMFRTRELHYRMGMLERRCASLAREVMNGNKSRTK